MATLNEMTLHYNELEDGDIMYESESTGDQYYVAQRLRSAEAGGRYFSVMCYEPSTGRNYWMRAPRRNSLEAAKDDLVRMALRKDNDWGEVIA